MNIQEEETSKIIPEQEEYSDEQDQDSQKSENFLLNYEEQHPDAIIHEILINIFNYLIKNKKGEINIKLIQNKIKKLCLGFPKNNIILWLLKLIRNIIQKLKGKILEIPNIVEFQKKNIRPIYYRKENHSQNKYSNNSISFSMDKDGKLNNKSCPKKKSYMNFNIAKTLFNHIKKIKNYLINAAPIIEEVFEFPLSEFEKFSILECEVEEYLRIIIHDDFIWDQINIFKNTEYDKMIQEITEGNDINIKTMTNKMEYFSQEIRDICSGLDERYPEDAKPIIETDIRLRRNNLFQNQIIEANNNEYEHNESVNNSINDIKEINNKNVKEIKVFKDIHSINKNINKVNFEKNFSKKNINTSIKISSINETNINSIANDRPNLIDLLNKEKSLKNKIIKNKKFNNNNKSNKKNTVQNKNYKIDKKEIPSDIDDLVKYIENDNKNDTQTKKKKKNKKKAKKKNKKEEIDKTEGNMNEEELKQKKEDDEINEIKENLLKNSINRFKIHKIKFKYKKEWLEQISKDF